MVAAAAFTQLQAEWPKLAVRFNSRNLDGRWQEVRAAGKEIAEAQGRILNAVDASGMTVLQHAQARCEDRARSFGAMLEQRARAWTWFGIPVYLPGPLPPAPELLPAIPPIVPGIEVPPSVIQRIPTVFRALAHSPGPQVPGQPPMPRGGLAVAVRPLDQVLVTHDPSTGTETFARLTLEVTANRMPILRVTVNGKWKGNLPSSFERQWADQWGPLLADGKGQFTDVASVQVKSQAAAGWQNARTNIRAQMMLPQLVEEMNRDRGLWEETTNYGGARALLALLVGLGLPTDRQQDDTLRAVLDGMPKAQGGIALPTTAQLAQLLIAQTPGALAAPNIPENRPLESYVTGQVAAAMWALDRYITKRQARPPRLRLDDPNMHESLARMDLSRRIVHVTALSVPPA
jgi:hypothetical protein